MKHALLVLLSAGCSPKMVLEVTVSDAIETVVTVRWTTPEDVDSHLEFGTPGVLERRSATSSGTQHEAVLIGLRPEEIVQLQSSTIPKRPKDLIDQRLFKSQSKCIRTASQIRRQTIT